MRIVILGPASPWRGGIAHFNDLLAREFGHDHEVSVLTFTRQYPGPLFPGTDQTHPGESVLDVGAEPILDSIGPWTWWATARRIRRLDPQILVVRYWMPFFAPAFGSVVRWCRRAGRPQTVMICDNVVPHERRPFDTLLTRYALAPIDRFVVMSRAVRADLLRMRPRAQVDVIPHPLYGQFGSERPREESRRQLDLSPKEPVLLFFGFVRRYKGLDLLLEAMPRVRERLPARLLVVGEFYEDEAPYRAQVERLGLRDCVRFVSEYVPNDEVATWFAAADVVVLPYRHATQSGIVPIAYHLGRPVIVTRVGGLPEVVDDGESGLLVPPEDPAAVAEAIVRFFEQDLAQPLRAGVLRARERFRWDRFAAAVLGERED